MMKIGGPFDGQPTVMSESPGGPDMKLPGMILEYNLTDPGKVGFRLYLDPNPAPSLPGTFERYQFRDDAWYYVEP